MTFDRPFALLLLAVPLVLLLLRLRARRPREAEASSLLVWRKVSPSDTAPARPRPPLAALAEAAGAALLAIAIGDPMGPPLPGPGTVRVLLDGSASMPRDRLLDAKAVLDGMGKGVQVQGTFEPEADLPAIRSAGHPVVVVTDHRLPDADGVAVVGLGRSRLNVGITAVSGGPSQDGRLPVLLTVEAHGVPGPVSGELVLDGVVEPLTVSAGRALHLPRSVGRFATGVVARITFPGDTFSGDDEARLTPVGGREAGFDSPFREDLRPVAAALRAAGAVERRDAFRSEGRDGIAVGEPTSQNCPITLWFPPEAAGAEVNGAEVAASPVWLLDGVRVDPSVTLGRRESVAAPVATGRPILADPQGPLVTVSMRGGPGLQDTPGPVLGYPLDVRFRFVPGGTWVARDPSFVVFISNLVAWATGGPPRYQGTGFPGARETREAAFGETFGDLRKAIEESRAPDPATREPWALWFLAGGAALLAAAWFAQR